MMPHDKIHEKNHQVSAEREERKMLLNDVYTYFYFANQPPAPRLAQEVRSA